MNRQIPLFGAEDPGRTQSRKDGPCEECAKVKEVYLHRYGDPNALRPLLHLKVTHAFYINESAWEDDGGHISKSKFIESCPQCGCEFEVEEEEHDELFCDHWSEFKVKRLVEPFQAPDKK